MALPSTIVWEAQQNATASNANGGGFDSAKIGVGTDYSQQTGVQYTFTNLASTNANNATPSVTSASHSFVTADEGNIIYISTAINNWTAGRYVINSTSGGAATLDRACGTAANVSNGTFAVGGQVDVLTLPSVTVGSSALPSGAATESTLSTLNGKVTAVNTGAVVISSSALPSGAATESTLSTLNGKVTAVNTGAVTISAALPAGNNNIGDVDIASLPTNTATDTINSSGTQGAVSVTNAATLISANGSSNLTSRKTLTAYNNSSTSATLYWGYTNGVTTSTGTPILYGQFMSWAVGASVSIYMIAASSSHDVRVTEGA